MLYAAFVLVLFVGFIFGRYVAHARDAEHYRAAELAVRVMDELVEALGECPKICERYAADECARDGLAEPPDDVRDAPWFNDVEAACSCLGAQDCAMLVEKHVEADHARLKAAREQA